MTNAPSDPVLFTATVAPHRSLPPRGVAWIMAALIGFSFWSGIGFVIAGAWPVTGFFGIDIALLYLAFHLSYRSARQRESLCLTSAAFDVERQSARGEIRHWRFEPAWLRVTLEEEDGGLAAGHPRRGGWRPRTVAARLPRRIGDGRRIPQHRGTARSCVERQDGAAPLARGATKLAVQS